MKNTDRKIPTVKPTHNEQTVEIWHADGPIYLSPADARKLADQLKDSAHVVDGRGHPPCPAPFKADQDEDDPEKNFAEAYSCDSPRVGKMLCSGSVGGYEFYLDHLLALHKWLGDCLQYHRDCGCVNLKKLEEKVDEI